MFTEGADNTSQSLFHKLTSGVTTNLGAPAKAVKHGQGPPPSKGTRIKATKAPRGGFWERYLTVEHDQFYCILWVCRGGCYATEINNSLEYRSADGRVKSGSDLHSCIVKQESLANAKVTRDSIV